MRTQVSALVAMGIPYDLVMSFPLATIWAEYEIIRLREGSRMASESLLMQSMLTAWFSGKGESYQKQLESIRHGR